MTKYIITILIALSFTITSCKKFLETKSVQTLATPSSLNDLEAILNNNNINKGTVLLNGMTDEYYYVYADWLSRAELQAQGYIWKSDLNDYVDWVTQYYAAFNANTVLFNLQFIEPDNQTERRNSIKGQALFYRALAHYRVAQLYAPQHNSATVTNDVGIPLRLSADINEESKRSTVQETYNQIINDLRESLSLLNDDLPNSVLGKTKPTKVAAYAFLSRVYLQMADYSNAKVNADACLSLYNTLMDFNDPTWVPGSASGSFKQLNPETIFYSLTDASPNSNVRAKIDSNLYKSYAANDLRKVHYFNKNTDNSYRFRGSYCGNLIELFCGFATDEVLLIRAECAAREGSTALAMKDINDLLRTRWKKIGNVTTYVDQVAATPSNALQIIISERKKELVYRELRWPDLRRLNKEQANSTTMSRELNGQTYLLSPADLRYTLLIPQEVIRITNLNQNPR